MSTSVPRQQIPSSLRKLVSESQKTLPEIPPLSVNNAGLGELIMG